MPRQTLEQWEKRIMALALHASSRTLHVMGTLHADVAIASILRAVIVSHLWQLRMQ